MLLKLPKHVNKLNTLSVQEGAVHSIASQYFFCGSDNDLITENRN